jgi:hypothetical protein
MTHQNPNVFYEVGYSHAQNKLCILATQSASDIPFDLKQHAHVIYNGTATDLREKLLPKLEWAKAEAQKGKNDRVSVTTRVLDASLTKEEYSHIGSFDLVIDLRNQTTQRSPEIEAIYIRVGKTWRATAHGKNCPFEVVNDEKSKRFLLTPGIKRLTPNGFSQERLTLSKTFWTKWSGDEQRETYTSKGLVSIELATSEGSFSHERSIDVQFEEFPF